MLLVWTAKSFPPLPELEEKKEFVFDRNELVTMLKDVSYAQSVNEERYMLKGVFFPNWLKKNLLWLQPMADAWR